MSDIRLVDRDGVIDYPIYPGQTLAGGWRVVPNPTGPAVTPASGFLDYHVTNQPVRDQWVFVSTTTPIPTAQGALILFRVRANTIQGEEVKFTIAGDVILRFTDGGRTVNWQWWDGTFHTLAASSIKADGTWHQIALMVTPGAVTLFEDGKWLFNWANQIGPSVTPRFDLQVWTSGASVSFHVGDILVAPASFAPGVNTPWDYSFTSGEWPSTEAMTFRIGDGGPQVSFGEGYVRFSAEPLAKFNTWSFLDIPANGPVTSIFTYPIRINKADGRETKITLPGGNILRVVQNGTAANWQWWDGEFHTLASSSITVGKPDFTLVTLVMTATTVTLLEDGVFRYVRSYAPVDSWNPGLAVQHLDTGTNVSVDIGGIRVLPSIKPGKQLAADLQNVLLAYFPLKGSLENAAGNSDDLIPVGGAVSYTNGPFGFAANFAGGTAVKLPRLSQSTSPSFTLSAWVKVNNYPAAGKLTGIAGALLLDSEGRVNFQFLFNRQAVYENRTFKSVSALARGKWQNVIVTYSSMESRLGIYIDGKIDSLLYLDREVASSSALVPAYYYVGGYQAGYGEPMVVLDGAVSDIMFLTQHLHQPTVDVLANVEPSGQKQVRMIPFIVIPIFIGVVAVTTGIIYKMAQQQDAPQKPPKLEEIVQRIRSKVGEPARKGARVSRADVGIPDDYPVHLDIGGEGRLEVSGLVTGFNDSLNVNAPLNPSSPRPPKVTVGGPKDGQPIPNLIELQPWSGNPEYPFADNFADRISMIGSPLMDKNVDEMARVIRKGGSINLWIDESFAGAALRLAQKLNSVVEFPAELPDFRGNGTWMRYRRIVARK